MFARGRFAVVLAVALLGSIGIASPATASDGSVKAAWDANDPAFTKLGKQQRREFGTWERAGYRKPAALLEVFAATRKLLATNTRAVRAQTASSPTGAKAKRYVLASNASFDRSLVLAASGVRLRSAGKTAAGRRRLASADRYIARSGRQATTAKRLFRQAR